MKKQTLRVMTLGLLMASSQWAQAQVSIAQLAPGQKYTALTVTPDTQGLTPQQKQMLTQIKTKAQNLTSKISSLAGQAFTADKGLSQILVNMGDSLKSDLAPQLETLKSSLPAEDALYVSLYVLPWAASEKAQVQNSVLSMIGPVQEQSVDLTLLATKKNKVAEFYSQINSVIRGLKISNTDQFQLQSIAFHIKLIRGDSQIRVQLLGRLKQMSQPFVKDNEQVHIKALEIFGNEATSERPMMVMNITQNLQDKSKALPDVVIEFGQFGGVAGGLNGWKGQYQILSNPWAQNDCKNKLASTPALTGTLARSAAGNKLITKILGNLIDGTAIKFRILNLRLDAATLRISKMNLAMEVGTKNFPQCLTAESVNTQFMGEANAAIESQLNTLYKQDDMTDDLMNALYK